MFFCTFYVFISVSACVCFDAVGWVRRK